MTGVGKNYIYISSACFFLASIFIFINAETGRSQPFISMCLLVATIIICHQLFLNQSFRRDKNWIQIDNLFLLMFFGVHFGAWALDYFGVSRIGGFSKVQMINYVDYSVALALMAMASFVLGFNLFLGRTLSFSNRLSDRRQWIFAANITFYVGFACTLLYVLVYGVSAFSGRYEGSDVGGLGVRALYLLQQILVKLGISMLFICHADKKKVIPPCIVSTSCFVGILLMYLVLGDRSEFVYTGAVGLFAYSISFRRIKLHWILLAIVSVAFVLSAVQISRAQNERSLSTLYEAITSESDDVSAEKGLQNISGSGFVLLTATTAVPDEYDFFNGQLKIKEALGIIPFGRFLFYKPEPSIKFDNSSTFFTFYLLGPNSTWGVGSTIVADVYVDFGPLGTAIALFFLGAVAGYLKKQSYTQDSFLVVVAFCFFAGLLSLLPRYSYLDIIRGLIWPLMFLWIVRKVLVKRSRRKIS